MISNPASSAAPVHRMVIAVGTGYSGHPNNTKYKAANGDKPIMTAVTKPRATPALIKTCDIRYLVFREMGSGVVAQPLTVSIAKIEYLRTPVTGSTNEGWSVNELIVLAEAFIRQSSCRSVIDEELR